jgi:hypothetical protein
MTQAHLAQCRFRDADLEVSELDFMGSRLPLAPGGLRFAAYLRKFAATSRRFEMLGQGRTSYQRADITLWYVTLFEQN